jgi:hypothetical protein
MPTNRFQFGAQTITTQVSMMVPREPGATQPPRVDVTAAMDEQPRPHSFRLPVLGAVAPARQDPLGADPFAVIVV